MVPEDPSPSTPRTVLAFSLLAAAALGPLQSPAGAQDVLIPTGATWSYLDDGSDQGSAWADPAFDDGGWAAGAAQLGYGDGDEATVVSFGGDAGNKFTTTYFRHDFTVADPAAYGSLTLKVLRDDGAVVYLNGVEVFRTNMPAGSIDYLTEASSAIGGAEESAFFSTPVSPALLVPGGNVAAVEIHQANATSSDISFDLELLGNAGSGTVNVTRGPYLQRATSTSLVVRWRTDVMSDSRVSYGDGPVDLTDFTDDPALATEHQVEVTGLLPETTYFYAVGTSSEVLAGANASTFFVTPPPAGTAKPTRVWVIGDSGTANADARAVRDAYLAFAGGAYTDLWLMLGDNAYNDGTDAEYQAAVFDTYPSILRQTVLWPTLGNHDGHSADSATQTGPYYDIFTLPTLGEAGGFPSGTEAYYSFDYGNLHFIVLDSHETDRSPGGAMMSWLAADVAATAADWVIAYWHHPPYSKGSHDSDTEGRLVDMRENALPVLEDAGVDLVLSGHSHCYERSFLLDSHYGDSSTLTGANVLDPGDGRPAGDGAYSKTTLGAAPHEGAVYAVAGSSGKIGGGPLDHPAMFISLNRLGSMVLDFDGNTLDAVFLDDLGAVADSFTITKAANGSPSVAITAPADGAAVIEGAAVQFTGTATDPEDGDLSAGLAWTSSLDGAIGSGASFSTSSLSCGMHQIDASVSDSGGLPGSDAITLAVTGAVTVPIAVDNFSFETPALADGGWTPNIPSWTKISGVSGLFDPTAAQFPGGVPDGENSAYSNGGTIGQTIAAETLVADAVYTLRVDVGDRADKPFPGYEIQLVVDGVVRASADETSVSPADGAFATATASFQATAADAGKSLEIRLVAAGEQPNFDNVRLSRSTCGGNTPPVVTITTPADGASLSTCDTIGFAGSAADAEDGDLSAALAWTSSLDGAIGTGASFSLAGLSVGSHTITASATDSGGLPGSHSISITVTSAPGAASIAVDNFSFETPALADGGWTPTTPSWIEIAGTSGIFDPTTASFPGGVPDGDNSAYSNGGTLGQTITAETLVANAVYTLSVDVGNRADKPFPGYEIQLVVGGVVRASADQTSISPADGAFATATASFQATPADAGQSLEIRLVAPGGQPNFDNVRLERSVCGGNLPPVVTITNPADGSSFVEGASVSFAATAVDAEDGDLSAGLSWTSGLDGVIGSGASFPTSSLSCGVHPIGASVADSGGLPGSDAITVTVTVPGSVPITVANTSFETPALADGGWTSNIPSWVKIAGTSGIFDPTIASFPGGVPDGDNSAYINGGTLGQTIAETLLPDTTYTLTVDVGDRADKTFPGYEIQLVAGGVVRSSADETSVSPSDGAFATATTSFTTTLADAGQALEIRLVAPGAQPNFDNVRLTRTGCPSVVDGLDLEVQAGGLASPVAITHAGDSRLFITLKDGRVVIFDNGQVLSQPFLDIRDRVLSGGERGLLSVAFHPDYANNGFLFADYIDLAGDTVISRFSVSADPDVADASSEAILLGIPQPYTNHNGGQLQFGPDGFLYIATGDGGSGNDPGCRGQNTSNLLGKILRLDVDQNVGTPPFHGIPASNPFVGVAGARDEIWAFGLRNPWRFSFDRTTGDMYIADVGQAQREEVDLQPAAASGGENYGWKVMEGFLCTGNTSGCSSPVPACNAPQLTLPIFDYAHSSGRCSITGGYVYRGSAIPQAVGAYFYGDWCTGEVWAAEETGGFWLSLPIAPQVPGLTSFGEGADGELYLVAGSTLYRLTGPP